jgi:hypothetical protein
MKRHAAFTFAALALAASAASIARADVSWEHKGTIKVSSLPMSLMDLKMFTNYAPGRSRVLVKYHSPFIPVTPIPASTWKDAPVPPELRLKKVSGTGSFGIVQRFDDDRLVVWESQTGAAMDESWSGAMQHLIVDPFKKTDPTLGQEEIPNLTEAQRRRLGREMRAFVQPITKRFSRTFFRELKEKRTFNGIEGRGFRLTQTFFAKPTDADQLKISAEWWLAGDLPGDELIRSAQTQALEKLKGAGYPSKSMWGRELPYVLINAFPEAAITALRTFAPGENFTGFGGTPLELNLTLSPPASAMGMAGEVRAQIVLVQRNTDTLAPTVFEAPANYKKLNMVPVWKQLDALREKGSLEGIMQEVEKHKH